MNEFLFREGDWITPVFADPQDDGLDAIYDTQAYKVVQDCKAVGELGKSDSVCIYVNGKTQFYWTDKKALQFKKIA